ncbi:ABC transporter ATP-binding protein [Corynebacterium provencense]|jgi:sulfonate transport system ATP-binding protein|uniref:ABC transporter ATP-binding protein n=1 Tax=Corynebacterium provencense TaxID=1737425 RepID=UPI00098FE197
MSEYSASDTLTREHPPTAVRDERTSDGSVAVVRNLRKSYGEREVLGGIDLDIRRGEIVALIGRSGSGKSTILKILAGLSDSHSGEVKVSGHPAVAFQEPRLFPWLSVVDNVALGLTRDGVSHDEARTRASSLIGEVHLHGLDDAWPLTLSGGQAQRVSLARALISNPDLLLLDEPFGALDALTRLTAQQLLLDTATERDLGVLLVTHDVTEAVSLADRVILLDGGRITDRVTVGLPRPRRRDAPAFSALTARLLDLLHVTTPA